jgi:hypothetical protein
MQRIQKERADQLQKHFGDNPCDHLSGRYKEYTIKGDTGRYRCITCYRPIVEAHLDEKRADS